MLISRCFIPVQQQTVEMALKIKSESTIVVSLDEVQAIILAQPMVRTAGRWEHSKLLRLGRLRSECLNKR